MADILQSFSFEWEVDHLFTRAAKVNIHAEHYKERKEICDIKLEVIKEESKKRKSMCVPENSWRKKKAC